MKIPVLRREFFDDFSVDYLEMPREVLFQKISIEDEDHIRIDGLPIRFYTAVRAMDCDKVLVSNSNPLYPFKEQFPQCNELTTLAELAIIAAKRGLESLVDLSDPNVLAKMPECTVPFPIKVGVINEIPTVYMLVYANREAIDLMNKHLINCKWKDISKLPVDEKLMGSFKKEGGTNG